MTKIEQQVMAGVAVVYGVRSLLGRRALALYVLAASLWGLAALVWVARVRENFLAEMHVGVLAVGNFVLSAFLHTHLVVQGLTLALLVASMVLAADIAKSLPRGRGARAL